MSARNSCLCLLEKVVLDRLLGPGGGHDGAIHRPPEPSLRGAPQITPWRRRCEGKGARAFRQLFRAPRRSFYLLLQAAVSGVAAFAAPARGPRARAALVAAAVKGFVWAPPQRRLSPTSHLRTLLGVGSRFMFKFILTSLSISDDSWRRSRAGPATTGLWLRRRRRARQRLRDRRAHLPRPAPCGPATSGS